MVLGSRESAKDEAAAKELQPVTGVKGTVSRTVFDAADENSLDAATRPVEVEWGARDTLSATRILSLQSTTIAGSSP